MKINRQLVFNILDRMLVLILASLSYFFVIEAWNNYKAERTNMATGRIPIQGHPTMTICVGRYGNRLWLDYELNAELYYYRIPPNWSGIKDIESRKLEEGTNHFDDEEIILKKMTDCFAVISRPKENYQYRPQENRLIKIILPNGTKEIKTWPMPDGSYAKFKDLIYYRSVFVYFTLEENVFAIESGIDNIFRLSSDNNKVSMRKDDDSFEIMAAVEIDPRLTTYIEERGNCRKDSIVDLMARNFTTTYYQDVFLKDEYNAYYCGLHAICVPYQLPVNDSKLKACKGMETHCEMDMLQSVAKANKNKFSMKPCTNLEYVVEYQVKRLEVLQALNKELSDHNYNPNKTNFAIWYNFKKPEYTTINEEHYLVSLMDLIGLTGGTLGISIGFSFYGIIADVLDILLSLVLKIKAKRIGEFCIL